MPSIRSLTAILVASLAGTTMAHKIPVPNRRAAVGECTFFVTPDAGDTCEQFAGWWGITLDQLRAYNPTLSCPTGATRIPIQDWCVEMTLPPSTTTTTTGKPPGTTTGPTGTGSPAPSPTQDNVIKTCNNWYKVVSGDNCQKIVDKYKTFTLSSFYTWNPDVGTDCSGLPLGAYVCVGVPGTPTSPPTATPTNDPSKPTPTQENVTKDCKAWYKVVSGDGCQKIVDKYKTFSLADFYKWNPDVGTDCSALPLDTYVCVGVPGTPTSPPTATATSDPSKPSPTQDNVIKTCTAWYKVVSGDGCQKVVDKYGTFTLADFYKWNPDVGTDCSGLPLNTYVCVGVPGTPTTRPTSTSKPGTVTGTATPTPTQTGVSTTCRKWYYVVKGDGCQVIVDKFKITLANFYAWNKAVKTDCSNLQTDVYVCVGQ